jgi:hypothetical protein
MPDEGTFIVPDVVGEVVGWRAWQVVGDERLPLLASVTHAGTRWHASRWTHGTCGDSLRCPDSEDGRVPGEHCSCGLYAGRDRRQLVDLGYGREHGSYPGRVLAAMTELRPILVGQVGLTGKVIPGSQGWRAEKGRIVKLHVPFHHWRYVKALRDLYGCEVVLDNNELVDPAWGQEGVI